MTGYWAEYAWVDGALAERVRLVERDGRWLTITPNTPTGARRLPA